MPEGTPTNRKQQLAETVREHLAERDVRALVRVVSAPSPYVGASVLVEAYGLGGLVPNTVLMGATSSEPDEFTGMIKRMHDAGRNVVLLRTAGDVEFGDRARIDVWLRSMRDNGALMLTLANTLKSSRPWKRATITLRMVVPTEEAKRGADANLRALLTSARLDVEVDVIADDRPVGEVIAGLSSAADLTMVGLPDPCLHEDVFGERFDAVLANVSSERSVAFVLSSNDVDLEALLD